MVLVIVYPIKRTMERNMSLDLTQLLGTISCQKLQVVVDENGNILEFADGLPG